MSNGSVPGQESALPVKRAAELSAEREKQKWLITGLWAHGGVGVIGGPPKCCKSWLGLEMVVSLASNTPCLGAFAPRRKGKALLYMAEDSTPVVRSRFDFLSRHHGVELAELDIFVITEPSLRIDLPDQQRRLRKTVEQFRPDMLLLDPLVRMHRIDENSAGEVSTLLGFLRALQREFQTAVVLVHHTRKNGAGSPGQALRGSGDLHAFGDSNLYLKRHHKQLLLTVEHRAAKSPEPVELRLVADETPHLELADRSVGVGEDLAQAVQELLQLEGTMTRSALREQLRIRNERLGKVLASLHQQGCIERISDGWRLRPNEQNHHQPNGKPVLAIVRNDPEQLAFPFPSIGVSGNGTYGSRDDSGSFSSSDRAR